MYTVKMTRSCDLHSLIPIDTVVTTSLLHLCIYIMRLVDTSIQSNLICCMANVTHVIWFLRASGWFVTACFLIAVAYTGCVEPSHDPTGPKTELLCPLERNVAASSCEINHAGKNFLHASLSVTHAILVLPFMESL